MNTYYLKNPFNGDVVNIKAYNWEIQSYQHTFIGKDKDNELVFASYSTKNWDIVNVEINR
jgi:hypothetical protein